jgi:hypothetical protein
MRGETADIDAVAAKFFRQRQATIDRIAKKMRFR